MAEAAVSGDAGTVDECARRVGPRAVAWLAQRLDLFDPDTRAPGDRTGRLAARKALSELATLVLCRHRLGPTAVEPEYLAMVELLAEVCARRSYRDLIARHHRSLWLYAPPYAALRAWGRDDPELRWMVEQAVAARYPVTWERLPYRYLDYLHLLDACGIQHGLPSMEDAVRYTLLHASPNVCELTEDDAYAITHAIFYLTGYGMRATRWPDGLPQATALDLVCTLLRHYRVGRHADLVAELLISAVCAGGAAAPEAARAWSHLDCVQDGDGGIAAPEHLVGPEPARLGPGGEQPEVRLADWGRRYHTTHLAALAALLSRRAVADGVPRPVTPGDGAVAGPRPNPLVSGAIRRGRGWLAGLGADRSGEERLPLVPSGGAALEGMPVDALAFDAVVAFREHRLGDAAFITLALIAAGARDDRVVADVVEALLAQQRRDGSFGYAAADSEGPTAVRTRRDWTAQILELLSAYR